MFIKRLRLKKLLSFNDTEVELRQLNVLIGPNGVGKSNLIEAVSLLQAAPTSLARPLLQGGGVREWLWHGDRSPIGTVKCELSLSRGLLVYELEFTEDAQGFVILSEVLKSPVDSDAYFTRSGMQSTFGPPRHGRLCSAQRVCSVSVQEPRRPHADHGGGETFWANEDLPGVQNDRSLINSEIWNLNIGAKRRADGQRRQSRSHPPRPGLPGCA